MKVKYIGPDLVAMKNNKIYDVLDIKHGSYQVMTELDEMYYLPQKCFELIDDSCQKSSRKSSSTINVTKI